MTQQGSESVSFGDLTEDEIDTANILLELHHLIFESKTRLRFPSWVRLKKRSKRLPIKSCLCFSSSSLLAAFSRGTCGGGRRVEVGPTCYTEGPPPMAAVKAVALSPSTPLSFSPSSESDDRSKHTSKPKLLKKKREDWLKITDGLTQHRDSLKREIENIMRCYDGLKAFNLGLKARKNEFYLGHMKENPYLENGKRLKLASQLVQPTVNSLSAQNQDHQQQIPSMVHQKSFIVNQTVQRPEISDNVQHLTSQLLSSLPSSTGFGYVVNNHVGPTGLPDLNFSPMDAIGMDSSGPYDLKLVNRNLSKEMAAQARQRRMQIYRVKNSIAAQKARCTNR
ncbi:Dihydroxy-acid dehydratase 1 [Fagus crenata]